MSRSEIGVRLMRNEPGQPVLWTSEQVATVSTGSTSCKGCRGSATRPLAVARLDRSAERAVMNDPQLSRP